MTEPRYKFFYHPCTTPEATALPNNMVVRDTWFDCLVVRQRTETSCALVRSTQVRVERGAA
jgi:hypothetical protein